jgi:hypothetical protein
MLGSLEQRDHSLALTAAHERIEFFEQAESE